MNIRSLLVCGIVVASVAEVVAAKKYIFSSWELGDLTPEEILAHADAFDRTGCDNMTGERLFVEIRLIS